MAYTSAYTGAQIDSGIERALNPDNVAVSGSTRPYQSGAAYTKFASVDANIATIESDIEALEELETLIGTTDPTTSTEGVVGQFYFNKTTSKMYICTAVSGSTYTWTLATAGRDGRGISSITKTSTSGLVDTYTITYSDSTTSTFTVTNGAQGATGASASVTATEYQVDTQGSTVPTGTWSATIPTVTSGQYLWTRFTWNNSTYSYIIAKQGTDGSGSGDMTKAVYDADNTVATAGGIEDFVKEYSVAKNASITGATKCKVTYDVKGLVTAGADLSASDIPSLTVSKLSDITATATELNTLDGITATTSELNILDGVTATASELNTLDGITATTNELNYTDGVTSNIQTQLDGKASKPDMGTISLSATWTGSASPYSQTVTVSGATVTSNSKVDIQPDSTALAQMLSDGCNALYISNNNGTLTAYAIGSGTTTALTLQCSVTEVTQ